MKDKLKKVIKIIPGLLIGFILGYISVEYLNDIIGDFSNPILGFIFIFIMIFISFYLNIIIHESGHLVFGLLSGYSFVSFRILSLILVKIKGKFYLKKYHIPGTGGQCLLLPPEVDKNYNYPVTLYNLGGGIFNIIFSIIFFLSFNIVDSNVLKLFLFLSGTMGILSAIINLIPLKAKGLFNDGSNLILIKKDYHARRAFFLQLKINYLLTNGIRFKDMDEEYFEVDKEADYNNYIINSIIISKANYYLDKLELDNAKEYILKLLNSDMKLLDIHVLELKCELLFLEIINNNKSKVESIYNKNLKKYIDFSKKYTPGRRRLLYAYELIINEDIDKANEELKKFNKLKKSYPYLADIYTEEDLINLVDNKYKEIKTV